jgi:hypothetical protein
MRRIACLTLVLTLAGAATAAASDPFVAGSGTGSISLPGFEGQTLQAEVAATSAGGAFHVAHSLADGRVFGESWGSVDCLQVSGHTARVTGTVVHGTAPGAGIADLAGHRVALTVVDGEPDAFRFDISFLHGELAPLQAIPPCTRGNVPIELTSGGFLVGH